MSRSMAPGLVTSNDIMEFDRDGEPVDARGRNGYAERYIHAAIYRVRPDVKAIVHSHSPDIIPYSVTGTTLRPVFHKTAFLRLGAPIFDSQKDFGDTDMLIRDNKIGDALAKVLGKSAVALIRGHGFVAVADSTQVVVYRAIYTQVNARVQAEGMKLGTDQISDARGSGKGAGRHRRDVRTAVGIVEGAGRKDRIAGSDFCSARLQAGIRLILKMPT